MNLIFFGTQEWAGQLLEQVVQDGFFRVVAVVTQPDRPSGRARKPTPSPVKQMALKHGLTVLQPETLADDTILDQLRSLDPRVALVVAFGRLLPKRLLDLVPLGFVNVHPSLLPRWRGPSPVQTALAAGDRVSGVTIMKLDSQMDHGPILAQQRLEIAPLETAESFMRRVADTSESLLLDTLKGYIEGRIVPIEQDHSQATFCKMLEREDGRIDWRDTAEAIERKIRAYQPWPGTWTVVEDEGRALRLKIIEALLSKDHSETPSAHLFAHGQRLFVLTGSGVLEITVLQPEGKPPMPAQAFLSGYGRLLGRPLA